jgi:hypothetical protein
VRQVGRSVERVGFGAFSTLIINSSKYPEMACSSLNGTLIIPTVGACHLSK